MDSMPREADYVINNAINALKKGDRLNARRLARQAATLAPELEYAWLILAETSSLKASIAYLENAVRINPDRLSSQKQLHQAQEKVGVQNSRPASPISVQQDVPVLPSRPVSKSRSPLLGIFTGLFVISLVFWGWWGRPVAWLSSVSQGANPAKMSVPQTWAGADILKPTRTPTVTPIPTFTPLPTATATPFPTVTVQPTLVPTQPVIELPIPTGVSLSGDHYVVQAGDTLFGISQKLGVSLADLAAANSIGLQSVIYIGQSLAVPQPGMVYETTPLPEVTQPPVTTDQYILVDISEQHLYAYDSGNLVFSFVASTGMNNATRTGLFSVLDKIPNAYGATWDLWMPNWLGIYWAGSLENGIHALPILSNGTQLWAGYLGTPISFGCIVLGVNEAQQLYDWVVVGTPVEIQW
jgi:lipoprotein-anchoring transpeptidase ErfK/SrfK